MKTQKTKKNIFNRPLRDTLRPVVTVAVCAPVLELAEAREVELKRGLRRISNAVDEDGTGMGSHSVIIEGVRHGLGGFGVKNLEGNKEGEGIIDDDPGGRRGRVMLGMGAFELAAAAAVSHQSGQSRADHAAARQQARQTEVRPSNIPKP